MHYQKLRNVFLTIPALAVALLTINPLRVEAVGNHLDQTLNGSGLRNINISGTDRGRDAAIQSDGKIVVAGTVRAAGAAETDFAVARLNANGLLDTAFSGNGTVVTPVLGEGQVHAVAIQPDGKIVVAGSAVVNGNRQFCLVRYQANGSLDTTFDGNGIVYTLFEPFTSNHVSEVLDVAIQPDGKIVAAGYVRGRNSTGTDRNDWVIARYNANGSLDATFDNDGKLFADFGGDFPTESAYSVVVQPDGKILTAGGANSDNGAGFFALARYNTDGATDFSFGAGTGRVTTQVGIGTSLARIYTIKRQTDGKIVAGGGFGDATNPHPAMIRYNANGSIDTTFGSSGRASFASFDGSYIHDLIIQPDGKIAGTSSAGFETLRFNPNGTIDAGFGLGGTLETDVASVSGKYSIALQADGKFIVAGYASVGDDTDFFVARYLPEMGKPFDFDGDGKTELSIFRPSNGQWWINRSSNNATFATAFGTNSDRIMPADFTGDGKTDIALFRPSTGQWFILRSEDSSFYSLPFGVSTDTPVGGDFDGDSKADLGVFRPATGTWYISRSSGGTSIVGFGTSGDVPVVGDYDGDGKADLAVFRPSNGQWWVQRSSNGTTFALTFGISTDKPVPGDYTGDGKTDIAFWRPSDGFWYILRSQDQSFFSFPFGTGGDIPAPGDYDGDGKWDAAVFRSSNSTWYAQTAAAGTIIAQYGLNGDRPVPGAFVP